MDDILPMARLSDERVCNEVSRIARQVYSLASLPEIGGYLGSELGRMFGHDSMIFCEADKRSWTSTYHSQTVGGTFVRYLGIVDRYMHQAPFIPHYTKHPGDTAMRTYDIVSPAAWRQTELCREAFAPLGFSEQLGVEIPSGPNVIRGLILNREKRGFTTRDIDVLNLLKEHIAAAAAIADQWRRLDEGHRRSGGDALERRGSIVLDQRSRPILWSPEAGSLLRSYAPVPAVLPAPLPSQVEAWALGAIAAQGSRDLWNLPRQPLRLRAGERELTLRLSSAADAGCHLLLLEESPTTHFWHDGIRRLSRREREVLAWIAKGKTNDEIARILGMSVYTVKNHVKRILDCLGVSNRTAAATAWIQACEA